MKGIMLAGDTRRPLMRRTAAAVYDKPDDLLPAVGAHDGGAIRDILIISTPTDLPNFERLLGEARNSASTSLMRYSRVPTGWRRRSASVRSSSAAIPVR